LKENTIGTSGFSKTPSFPCQWCCFLIKKKSPCASFSILFKGTKFKKKNQKKTLEHSSGKKRKGSEPKIYLNLTHKNIAANWFYDD
jgi:hypothetical protein